MHAKLLIDDIVRQTTVLIAQLSTAAGIRAPLAHIADQVFVDLSRELEAAGVRRKVVADMFGLALRSYQLKVHRLTSGTPPQASLWQSVHALLEGSARTREELNAELQTVDPKDVAAVLNDLVDSGLAYSSGRGMSALYGLTSEADRQRNAQVEREHSRANMAWLMVATGRASTSSDVAALLGLSEQAAERAIDALLADGRLVRDDTRLQAEQLHIPVGAAQGWEVAVADHFRAMVTAVASKLSKARSSETDRVGGATLTYNVHGGHPCQSKVLDLLKRTRAEADALWNEVEDHNRSHTLPSLTQKVTFYFGQNVAEQDDSQIGAGA